MVRVPCLKHKDSFLGPPKFTFFFPKPTWPILNFPLFLMSNEINLPQILCEHLKYLFFSVMNVKIVKFIQCGPCSINGPKFPKKIFFENLYIAIYTFFLSYSNILYTLVAKVFVVEILKQNNLFRPCLWVLEFFFLTRQSLGKDWLGILKLVQIWNSMHKIVF
jgi:hypothetical protein